MKNVLLLLSVLGCLSSVYGQKVDTTLIGKQQTAIFNRPTYDYSIKAPKAIDDNQDFQSLDITSHGGDLADALGNNIYNVDSLVVRGSINDTDIHTLWEASFKGRLSIINLENAEIENGIIPEDAFWHQSEQLDPSWEFINTIHLRRIILPDGVKRIEEMAFSYCINLEEVNIPSSLQYLGTYAFSDCVNLKTDPLVFSEGFERFGNLVFQNCRSLTGEVVLPSTIKEIGDGAFFCSKISSINLPEGLEKIGDAAFYACRLKEVWIPNSCQTIAGTNTFQQNYPLKKIHLPEGLGRIPSCFANDCWDLQEVNIPSTVKSIDRAAFEQCESLKKINLPNGLETIEREAFYHCDSLEQIIFPATLNFLGQECCSYMPGLKRIYCMSSEPPVCKESTLNPGNSPFGKYNSDFYLRTPNDIPIYVPIGAAEKYRNAWGWDYFTNFIETDDFPTAIHNVTTEHYDSKNCVYDLMGRKVINPQNGQVYIKNGKKTLFAY